MDKIAEQNLLEALSSPPLVLLLGQRFLARGEAVGPVIEAIEGTEGKSFDQWWFGPETEKEDRGELLRTCGIAVPISDEVAPIRSLPWKCAFTSNIDPASRRLLEVEVKRPVVERFQKEENPDFTALPLFRLFGSVGRPETSELPPTTKRDLQLRRAQADDMLRVLSQIVTPKGRLIIDGWDPTNDWLRPRDLGKALSGFAAGQVLAFGIRDSGRRAILDDDDLKPLIEDGVLLLFQDPLAELILRLTEAGSVTITDPRLIAPDVVIVEVVSRTPDRLSTAAQCDLRPVKINQSEWRSLNETFSILRPVDISAKSKGNDEERYKDFRRFLGHGPESQLERAAEFSFRRPQMDSEVLPAIRSLLKSPSPQDQVLLIAGQSGSGKTTLLSLLAVDLRKAGIPVVFARRGVVTPNEKHLDKFAQMVERAESEVPVVLIYDGLHDESDYVKTARAMAARGRKVLVVGSTYELNNDTDATSKSHVSRRKPVGRVVSLKRELDNVELGLLLDHLKQFLPHDHNTLQRIANAGYSNFFATLYHLLDDARPKLREGLVQEIERESHRLSERLGATPEGASTGDFQEILREALNGTVFAQFLVGGTDLGSGEHKTKVDRLIDAVMVAGRFDVPVPQTIALRLLGGEHACYLAALRVCRVIEEKEVADGVVELAARQPLEADIWCRKRLPQEEDQFSRIGEMVKKIQSVEIASDHSPETTFVAKILRAIGPQGRGGLGTGMLPKIAALIQELRSAHQRVSPRLFLIESNATREWVMTKEQRLRLEADQRHLTEQDATTIKDELLPRLKKAASILQQASEMIAPAVERGRLAPGARRLLSSLHTELACVFGTELMSLQLLFRCPNPATGLISLIDERLDDALRALQQAVLFNEDGVPAYDTACWILKNRLSGPGLTLEREAHLLAVWEEIIDEYGGLNLSDVQLNTFDSREADLSKRRGDISRFEAILSRMERRGGTAVHVLKARYMSSDPDCGAKTARDYLKTQCGADLFRDRAALLCYYRLWWQTETHEESFFSRDHLSLAFDRTQWDELADLANARLRLEGEKDNCMALFHLGWALLQTGKSSDAKEVFDHLEMASMESYRRGRTLALLSNSDGTRRELYGETRGKRMGNRGLAWVDELRLEVPYPLFEFDDGGGRSGRRIGPFYLAINYRGAFATPTHYKGTGRKG